MVQFIDNYRGSYGVEPICRILPIAPSIYHRAKDVERYSACLKMLTIGQSSALLILAHGTIPQLKGFLEALKQNGYQRVVMKISLRLKTSLLKKRDVTLTRTSYQPS